LSIIIILAGYTPPFNFNFLSIAVAAVLVFQIIFKHKRFGLIVGGVFLLLNLFFLGALCSAFIELQTQNFSGTQLLIGGLLLWSLSTFLSGTMIYKYTRIDN